MRTERKLRRRRVVAIAFVAAFGPPACGASSTHPCPTAECDPGRLAPRSLSARRIAGEPPVVDGRLDDAAWAEAEVAGDFVESSPRPAAPASLRSEARVLVDAAAIYVAFRYFDPRPETIQAPLVRRDDEITSDWAFFEVDSRHDRHSGFSFGVNPRGVLADGAWLSDTDYDGSWNAVWQGAARIDDRGWTAEIRVPFSQLPFRLDAGARELVWGANFYRYSPSHGESSNWSPRYRGLGGVVSNFNELRLPAPPRPHRLAATPYAVLRAGDGPEASGSRRADGGVDLQAGLGANFRLTATLLPDFGQVEADPSQVNLSAFELFQPEQRPFFLEETDLFRLDTSLPFATRAVSFGDEAPFYSRRVGRPPRGEVPADAEVLARPAATRLLGAAKLTGQTAGGWTLGGFTALTDGERARVRLAGGGVDRVPIEARAATTVLRVRHDLSQGYGSFGLFATDLHRLGLSGTLADQEVAGSTVAGADLRTRFGERRFEWRSWLLASLLQGSAAAIARVAESSRHLFQRPGARGLPAAPYGTSLGGWAGESRVDKVDGALRWNLVGRAVSPGLDVDETGYQQVSDWLLLTGGWSWERFRPQRRIRALTVGSRRSGVGWTWSGQPRTRVADGFVQLDTRGYRHLELEVVRETSTLSTAWLRGGPAVLLPPRSSLSLSVLSDQRRASYVGLDLAAFRESGSGSAGWSVAPVLNVRSSARVEWSVGAEVRRDLLGWQPVGSVEAGQETWVVARVRQRTLALTLRGDLIPSPRLSLQLYLRPFATAGRYDAYQRLVAPRAAEPGRRFAPVATAPAGPGDPSDTLRLDLDGDGLFEASLPRPDGARRALDASLVMRWEVRPGSFLTAVWNQQRRAESADPELSAARVLGDLAGDPAADVFLLKLSFRLGG